MEIDRNDKETFVIDKRIPSADMTGIELGSPSQGSDTVFISDSGKADVSGLYNRNKTRLVSEPFNERNFGEGNDNYEECDRHYGVDPDVLPRYPYAIVTNEKLHRTAWAEPHVINPADFPLVEDAQASVAVEGFGREIELDSHSYHGHETHSAAAMDHAGDKNATGTTDEFRNSSRYRIGHVPPGPSEEGMGGIGSPRQQFVDVPRESPRDKGVARMIPTDDAKSPPGEVAGNLLNVGDDLEVGATVSKFFVHNFLLCALCLLLKTIQPFDDTSAVWKCILRSLG